MLLSSIITSIPASLVDDLEQRFLEIERNYRENRWEPAELNGGKLCEVVYCILKGFLESNYPASATKPANFLQSCRNLEQYPSTFPRSIRIQIPRMLVSLYEIRNNRGVGHVGGDVPPNKMDAICVLHMSKWILSELVRAFHGVSITEAENIVSAMSERELPVVWQVGDRRRVLTAGLSMLDKTLLLLYSQTDSVPEASLFADLEHSNSSVYRRDILRKAHKNRYLEYEADSKMVVISPLGIAKVENELLAGD